MRAPCRTRNAGCGRRARSPEARPRAAASRDAGFSWKGYLLDSDSPHLVMLAREVDDHLARALVATSDRDLLHRGGDELARHRVAAEALVDDLDAVPGLETVRLLRIHPRLGPGGRRPRHFHRLLAVDLGDLSVPERFDALHPRAHVRERLEDRRRLRHHLERPDRVEEREVRSEEHTSELQSHSDLVCRLLLEKKKKKK